MQTQREKLRRGIESRLTRREFAFRCGFSQKHLSEIIAGKTGVSPKTAATIVAQAAMIGCQIDGFRLMLEAEETEPEKARATA